MGSNLLLLDGSPTLGGTNGTLVTNLNPVDPAPLNTGPGEESPPVKLAIRADPGFERAGPSAITPQGANASKWALAPDNNGEPGAWGAWGAALVLANLIQSTNLVFWAKARVTPDESYVSAIDDISVIFSVPADAYELVAIGKSLAGPYGIYNIVGKSLGMPGQIKIAASKSLDMPYILTPTVGLSLAQPFGVIGAVGKSLGLPYKVIVFVGKSNGLPYTVKNIIGKSNGLPYTILPNTTTVQFAPSFDGQNRGYSAFGTWQSVRDGAIAAGGVYNTGAELFAGYSTAGGSGSYSDPMVGRNHLHFDTSSIPDGATIVSARLRLYGHTVYVKSGYNTASSAVLVQSLTPAGAALTEFPDTYINNGTNFNSTELAPRKTHAAWNDNAYNDFVLNGTGLAAINKTGTTRFCLRQACDVDNSPPAAGLAHAFYFYPSEESGTSKDPILEVVYS